MHNNCIGYLDNQIVIVYQGPGAFNFTRLELIRESPQMGITKEAAMFEVPISPVAHYWKLSVI